MGVDTISSNWGAVGIASYSGELGLGARGTLYAFRNFDTGDKFLFVLADLGFGVGWGFSVPEEIRQFFKAAVNNKNMEDLSIYTMFPANKPFSATDLNFARGSEATAGVAVVILGTAITLISAWPFFQGASQPGQEVNNDYFSGAEIRSNGFELGLQAKAAYQFLGVWVKVWSL